MSQSFIISATVFITVMVVFHLVKDYILRAYIVDEEMSKRINSRWLISTAIGLLILSVIYSCSSEVDICSKKDMSDNSVICTKIYQPVRAPDGTIYGNACMAEADGWDNGCLTLINDT